MFSSSVVSSLHSHLAKSISRNNAESHYIFTNREGIFSFLVCVVNNLNGKIELP
jgi:hypothetical protein